MNERELEWVNKAIESNRLQTTQRHVDDPNLTILISSIYRKMTKESLRGKCVAVSQEVALESGLAVISGWFLLDRPMPLFWDFPYPYPFLVEPHTWNEDFNGVVVDLTAQQFNNGLFRPLTDKITIVRPTDTLYPRYIKAGEINNLEKYRIM